MGGLYIYIHIYIYIYIYRSSGFSLKFGSPKFPSSEFRCPELRSQSPTFRADAKVSVRDLKNLAGDARVLSSGDLYTLADERPEGVALIKM